MTVEERLTVLEERLAAIEALLIDDDEFLELEDQHQRFASEIKEGKGRRDA